jgi:hypothetical protein
MNLFNPPKFIKALNLELEGPDGNAFMIMAMFQKEAKREG